VGDLERLRRDRRRAEARLAALTRDLDDIVERSNDAARDDEHDPEGATIAFERAQVSALLADTRRHLDALAVAETRVRDGHHDRCERCGGPIPAERHEVRPTATTCVRCASAG
jgi:DnaK suppressor protein